MTTPANIEAVLSGAREQFDASTDGTLGVEEEYAICDGQTLDLVSRYDDVVEASEKAGLSDSVAGELIASEVEFRTGKCDTFSDAVDELIDIRGRVTEVFGELGLAAGTSSTHPWADYRDQQVVDSPYYRELTDRMRYVTRRNVTFGLHVHVGVRGVDRAVRVADALRVYQPLMLAISGSSPFLDGLDTGLASTRWMTFSRWFPRGNVAPAFGDWDSFASYVQWLREAGSITSYGQMWWGVRVHAVHGTVECRMFDSQPDVCDSLALTALASGTIMHLADLYDAGELVPGGPHGVDLPEHLIDENMWRAARYGMDGDLLLLPSSERKSVRELATELVDNAQAASDRRGLGLDTGLARVRDMLASGHGTSSDRQRATFERTGSLHDAYREVVDQTLTDLRSRNPLTAG